MTDLFTAIMTRYSAVDLSSTLTGLYNTLAPQDAVFPYGTFSLISNVSDWSFSDKYEECLIQFNIFSDESSATVVCNAFELLKTAFDFYELSVANYDTVSMIRESAILTKTDDVWQYSVTYRIVLQEI